MLMMLELLKRHSGTHPPISSLNPSLPVLPPSLSGQVDRRSLLDNLDLLMLTVDELVDGDTILETDSTAIVSRVLM